MPLRMQAWQLLALQGANWQRGGGKGTRPTVFAPTYPVPIQAPKKVIPLADIKDRLEAARRVARARSG